MVLYGNYRTKKYLVLTLLLALPVTTYSVDFATMLDALQTNAKPVISLVKAVAYVMGFWFIVSAIQELKIIGHMQHGMGASQGGGIGKPFARFILGAALIYFPSTIDTAIATLWGTGGIMQYNTGSGGQFDQIQAGVYALVQAVGYISFVRGAIILSRSTHAGAQQGSVGKGVVHMVGGVLAINIVATIDVIKSSFGFVVG